MSVMVVSNFIKIGHFEREKKNIVSTDEETTTKPTSYKNITVIKGPQQTIKKQLFAHMYLLNRQ